MDGDQGPAQVVFTFKNALHVGLVGRDDGRELQRNLRLFPWRSNQVSASGAAWWNNRNDDNKRRPLRCYTNTPICFVGATAEPF